MSTFSLVTSEVLKFVEIYFKLGRFKAMHVTTSLPFSVFQHAFLGTIRIYTLECTLPTVPWNLNIRKRTFSWMSSSSDFPWEKSTNAVYFLHYSLTELSCEEGPPSQTSLVAQWSRICLPTQDTRVRSLIQRIPCAAELSPRATTRAHALQRTGSYSRGYEPQKGFRWASGGPELSSLNSIKCIYLHSWMHPSVESEDIPKGICNPK